ncbi:MAG: hypothetical protein AAFR93_12015, partial [Pseudomonadota bacterium]
MSNLEDGRKTGSRRSVYVAFGMLVVLGGVAIATVSLGSYAQHLFRNKDRDVSPIIAGSSEDELPALMRGNLPTVTTSTAYNLRPRGVPPRMCDMPKDYFELNARPDNLTPGYRRDNSYVRPY